MVGVQPVVWLPCRPGMVSPTTRMTVLTATTHVARVLSTTGGHRVAATIVGKPRRSLALCACGQLCHTHRVTHQPGASCCRIVRRPAGVVAVAVTFARRHRRRHSGELQAGAFTARTGEASMWALPQRRSSTRRSHGSHHGATRSERAGPCRRVWRVGRRAGRLLRPRRGVRGLNERRSSHTGGARPSRRRQRAERVGCGCLGLAVTTRGPRGRRAHVVGLAGADVNRHPHSVRTARRRAACVTGRRCGAVLLHRRRRRRRRCTCGSAACPCCCCCCGTELRRGEGSLVAWRGKRR